VPSARAPRFHYLANIASSTPRLASLPSRFGDEASRFLVAVYVRCAFTR
jgi:hypothetical protein